MQRAQEICVHVANTVPFWQILCRFGYIWATRVLVLTLFVNRYLVPSGK